MGSIILKIEDLYILWELELQSPTVVWKSRADMEIYYRRLYGESFMSMFRTLLRRLERNGTTDPEGATVEDLIRGNRLGPNAREFTKSELYELCRTLPSPTSGGGDKWDMLLHAAQEVCATIDSALSGEMAWTENNPPPQLLRALRDLAVHCGCTHVSWWNPNMGEELSSVQSPTTGSVVWIRRGGIGRKEGPGHDRLVRAEYLGTEGDLVSCRLLEDDPWDTVGWSKAGDIGHWSLSSVSLKMIEI